MQINSKILKISGKIELPSDSELVLGQDIALDCSGEIVKIEEGNNQDGTFDRIYKVKIKTADSK